MSDADDFAIKVDVTNPGQFYACCGLMELAAVIDKDVHAHFESSTFSLTKCTQRDVWSVLGELSVRVDMPRMLLDELVTLKAIDRIRKRSKDDPDFKRLRLIEAVEREAPVWIETSASALRIGWWRDAASDDVKTWAGGQVTWGATRAMLAAARPLATMSDPFDAAAEAEAKPFYFDCRGGGDAIDLGAPVDANVTYPVVELLSLIGLQRFRPSGRDRRVKHFATWRDPLPISIAAAVASAIVPSLAFQTYRFRIAAREASYRYKSFARAEPINPIPEKSR